MDFFSRVQLDILVNAVNELDIKINTRREIPYLPATMYYIYALFFVYMFSCYPC